MPVIGQFSCHFSRSLIGLKNCQLTQPYHQDGSDESAISCPHVDKNTTTGITNTSHQFKDYSLKQGNINENENKSIFDQNERSIKEVEPDQGSSKIAKYSLLVNNSSRNEDVKENNVEDDENVDSKTSAIITAKVCDLTKEFDCGEGKIDLNVQIYLHQDVNQYFLSITLVHKPD